jgi:hypothetical protein
MAIPNPLARAKYLLSAHNHRQLPPDGGFEVIAPAEHGVTAHKCPSQDFALQVHAFRHERVAEGKLHYLLSATEYAMPAN